MGIYIHSKIHILIQGDIGYVEFVRKILNRDGGSNMSRIIKFRAWDVAEQEMFYGMNKCLMNWDGLKHNVSRFLDGDIPVMQYTGLKDKNGREIYEGDVLRQQLRAGLFVLYLSVWVQGDYYCGFYLERTRPNPYQYIDIGQERTSKLEIIGNIYENPELTEEISWKNKSKK